VEEDLGIEVFSTSSDGISGVIKQRYEDFAVKEIPLGANKTEFAEARERTGTYSVFWLEKRGLDTILAIKRIAKSLGVSEKRLSFAGMKDRNAVTLQRVSAWNISPDRLKKIRLNGIHIKDIIQSDVPVRLGSHWGNAFAIEVRDIPFAVSEVEIRVQRISNEMKSIGGVLNYFGHQRFGLSRPVTHIVGLKMLKGDFKDAAMVFLSRTSPSESNEAREARAELGASGDFKSAVKRFPVQLSYESAMLNSLASSPNNFSNAFRALPRNLLRMFVSAAQSWLFNKFISKRLKSGIPPGRCVLGDLVAPLDGEGLTEGEPIKVDESNIDKLNEELSGGKAVVVYPVPGFDMNLPRGMMYEIVRETMNQEGLLPRSFWISMMPEISSPGVLRSILLIPKNLKVTTLGSDSKGTSSARFEFSLIRGGYATVVLREFMKNQDPLAAGY
jgi:tRNA pseudouridine13 synthase